MSCPLERLAKIGAATFGLMATSLIGSTAATAAIPDSLRACVQEQDADRRLACYDREMARSEKAYGLSEAQQRKTESKSPVDAKAVVAKPQALSATVLAVTLRADGRNAITLDNGQVWVQGEAFERTPIHVGDAVSIKPGMLGSLYLYLPSKLRTRVTRER